MLTFKLTQSEEGKKTLTVFNDGDSKVADDTHVNFDAIVKGVLAGDEDAIDLFDPTPQLANYFKHVTERVTVANGRVYFDGDEIEESSLTRQMLRALEDGDEVQWIGLPNFYEKLAQNPNEHSREMLFDWLTQYGEDFTITIDGDLICYKGIDTDMMSRNGGRAIVDGHVVEGKIPNQVNSVVEMPRSQVAHAPDSACSTGLHVATHRFASDFGPVCVAVIVNPRDVVSVPTHADKIRVCRYTVKEIVSQPYSAVVLDEPAPALPGGVDDENPAVTEYEASVAAATAAQERRAKKAAQTHDVASHNSQSPLDQEPTYKKLVDFLCQSETPKPFEAVAWLESVCGVITTKDSLRRFKTRHGL